MVSRNLQRSLCGGYSMYRIFVRSVPTAIGFCLAGMLTCCMSCNTQSTANSAEETVPLSTVAVSPDVQQEVAVQPDVVTEKLANASRPILRVSVSGAKSSDGVYFCALFNSKEKMDQRTDPVAHEKFPAKDLEVTWEIESLPPGRYSVAAFHDANENGKVDRHALGYPIEAYGFSNNARGKFGPPAYEKIEFEIGDEPTELTIRLK